MDESMKANEAPKKIYLTQLMLFATPTISSSDNDVEYIRTDAFIEKACDWLINHNDYICGSTNGIVKYDMKQLIEDFRNYMER